MGEGALGIPPPCCTPIEPPVVCWAQGPVMDGRAGHQEPLPCFVPPSRSWCFFLVGLCVVHGFWLFGGNLDVGVAGQLRARERGVFEVFPAVFVRFS